MNKLARLGRKAHDLFWSRFGQRPVWTTAAPGRVNFIGEHTDYTDGYALPFAIDRYLILCGAPRNDQTLRIRSVGLNQESELSLTKPLEPTGQWTDYLAGVISGYQEIGLATQACDVLVYGDLPDGAGLSSSAALEVGTALMIESMNHILLEPERRVDLCHAAEHSFAGVPCGHMDQFAVVMGRQDHLMFLDVRSLSAEQIPFEFKQADMVVINSSVKHSIGQSEYPKRRAECLQAEQILKASLRDCDFETLEQNKQALSPTLYRRARHIISENQRTKSMIQLIRTADLASCGELLFQSHESLKRDFEVSCDETDFMVDYLNQQGAYGARQTGGGFGGAVIALIAKDRFKKTMAVVAQQYKSETGIELDFFPVRAVSGASSLDSEELR